MNGLKVFNCKLYIGWYVPNDVPLFIAQKYLNAGISKQCNSYIVISLFR